MTDAELQAEADRLMTLDAVGREREAVVIALRLGQVSEHSSKALLDLDYQFLKQVVSDVGADRETPGSEHLDA